MTRHLPVGCPVSSPWGAVDGATQLAEGIYAVSTPSHGGVWIAPALRDQVPPVGREYGKKWAHGSEGWYEEDVAWAIPALVFPAAFPDLQETARTYVASYCPELLVALYRQDGAR